MPFFTPGGNILQVDPPKTLPKALSNPQELRFVTDSNWWQTARKVLIIRNIGLGDVLMITPLVRHLALLGIVVDVATESIYTCLFDNNPYVNKVFSLETMVPNEYIWVLDLRDYAEHPDNQIQHRVDAFAEGAYLKLKSRHLDYHISPEEAATFPSVDGSLIAYVWGATIANRNWNLGTHEQVVEALILAGYKVAILAADAIEMPYIHKNLFNLCGKLSIRETALFINRAECVISPDTGLFHIASALNKPILAYFGAFPLADRQTHVDVESVVFPKKLSCLPCRTYSCIHQAGTVDCAPCLSVDVNYVLKKVKEVIGRSNTLQPD